jgi:leucyl-tRNA---protein transferase
VGFFCNFTDNKNHQPNLISVAQNQIYENLKITKKLKPKQFDKLMASGFFRNGQNMFKTQLMLMDEDLYTSIGIRLDLQGHFFSKSLNKIFKRNTAKFTVKVRPLAFSNEKQALWEQHQHRFVGASTHSLYHHFCYEGYNHFDSWEICVYDQEKLIAASFFDIGQTSMASMLGIFDQQYPKDSLGIYTMLVEVAIAKKMGLRYYYPGYVLDQPSLFDYKLRLGNFQQYNWQTSRWKTYDQSFLPTVATATKQKMAALQQKLDHEQIGYSKKYYQFYLWKYFTEFPDYHLLYPSPIVYVLGYVRGENRGILSISFDADTQNYFLSIATMYIPVVNMLGTVMFSSNSLNPLLYMVDALKVEKKIFEDPNLALLITKTKEFLAQHSNISTLLFGKNE